MLVQIWPQKVTGRIPYLEFDKQLQNYTNINNSINMQQHYSQSSCWPKNNRLNRNYKNATGNIARSTNIDNYEKQFKQQHKH